MDPASRTIEVLRLEVGLPGPGQRGGDERQGRDDAEQREQDDSMDRAAGQGRAHDRHAEQGGGADGQPGARGRAAPASMAMSPTRCRRGSSGLIHGRQNSLERRVGSQRTSSPLTRGFAAASPREDAGRGEWTGPRHSRGFAGRGGGLGRGPLLALRGEAGELGAGHCLLRGARGPEAPARGGNCTLAVPLVTDNQDELPEGR